MITFRATLSFSMWSMSLGSLACLSISCRELKVKSVKVLFVFWLFLFSSCCLILCDACQNSFQRSTHRRMPSNLRSTYSQPSPLIRLRRHIILQSKSLHILKYNLKLEYILWCIIYLALPLVSKCPQNEKGLELTWSYWVFYWLCVSSYFKMCGGQCNFLLYFLKQSVIWHPRPLKLDLGTGLELFFSLWRKADCWLLVL